jgi:O-acetyl-ADP-ribose deacetylase (regulator of RNase III)
MTDALPTGQNRYQELPGNIFASRAQTLVNTVNCVGVMGKGVALEFRRRFPAMFEEYARQCKAGTLRPGQILPCRKSTPWILNFAVKDDWKHPSKLEWVESCLAKFVDNYRSLGITSVAFPQLGAMNGGLPWPKVQELMRRYLRDRDLPNLTVEIYEFDETAPEPLSNELVKILDSWPDEILRQKSGLAAKTWARVRDAVRSGATSLYLVETRAKLSRDTMDRLVRYLLEARSSVMG